MSSYSPPTENLPSFNSSLFNSTDLTTKNYLQYPIAQGPETINTLTTTNFTTNTPIKSSANIYNYLSVRDCGVYMIRASGVHYPCLYSIPNCNNLYYSSLSGNVTSSPTLGGVSQSGTYSQLATGYLDIQYVVHPSYGIIVYDAITYGGTVTLCYWNRTNNPVTVAGSSTSTNQSWKIFYNNVEQQQTI